MLGLIDTPDPRYRRDEPEPGPGWQPNLRLWLPVGGSVVCFTLGEFTPPLVTYVLMIAGMVMFLDGVLSLLPSGDGLRQHRQ
ncbi:MAG: hypothetical protein QOD81_2939 [Solirubrobacteraceae bacterium]|jgi:hypothetical protein|nr:hypothetical protein [Solirubrobacteraceae bacterium]